VNSVEKAIWNAIKKWVISKLQGKTGAALGGIEEDVELLNDLGEILVQELGDHGDSDGILHLRQEHHYLGQSNFQYLPR
jgi:hypothetical protein